MHNKKYLKSEKIQHERKLSLFLYTSNMFDSVYRKDGKYQVKVFLEKFIHNAFWRNIRNFDFLGFESSS